MNRALIYTILLSLVLGAASGILGTAWTSSYLSDYALELSELTATLQVEQEKPRNLPSSYNEAVEGLIESSLPSIAEIYTGAKSTFGYSSDNLTERGVVLTTDGWIAIASVNPLRVSTLKSARIRVDEKMYSIIEQTYDQTTKTLFAKLDANNLSVVSFGNGRKTRVGEQVFIVSSASRFTSAEISQHVWTQAKPISSDEPQRRIELEQQVEDGVIVFNLNGDVIGFSQNGTVLPFESILPAFHSLLETKEISRPAFGVNFVDLSHQVDVPSEWSRGLKNGALLYTIKPASSAKTAGLRAGDILLAINNETINEQNGLDELLEQYKVGEKISVLYDRVGEVQTAEVVLGETK